MQLENKVAVITGAASGIGKEVARAFAQAGATVVIADRNAAAAHAVAEELASSRRRTLAVAMDVTSESEVESGMANVIAATGRIDVLVCNAGIQVVAPLDQLPFADWKRLLAIHLDGAFLTTRAALTHRSFVPRHDQHALHSPDLPHRLAHPCQRGRCLTIRKVFLQVRILQTGCAAPLQPVVHLQNDVAAAVASIRALESRSDIVETRCRGLS